jgi:hypothetical protein
MKLGNKDSHVLIHPLSILGLHEFVGTRMSESSWSFAVIATPHAYPNFLNKRNDPFEHKCQIGSTTFRILLMQVQI